MFLSTVHIRGTEVIAQETFTLTQEEVDLSFDGYGFKLHVPKDSLPTEVSETQLTVGVSLSGPFQMPFNSKLLSAVYWISIASPHKFKKPVTVKIQHCAALSSDELCSQLTFVRTKCTQKELPYMFKELIGGVFSSQSSYGTLSLSHFSGLAVAGSSRGRPFIPRIQTALGLISTSVLGQRQRQSQQSSAHTEAACQTGQEERGVVEQHCAQLYTCKLVNEWKVDFVVTKDLDSFSTVRITELSIVQVIKCILLSMQVVKKAYSSHAQQQFSFTFGFKDNFISLGIPKEGLRLDKWKISPFYEPKVSLVVW